MIHCKFKNIIMSCNHQIYSCITCKQYTCLKDSTFCIICCNSICRECVKYFVKYLSQTVMLICNNIHHNILLLRNNASNKILSYVFKHKKSICFGIIFKWYIKWNTHNMVFIL